MKLDFEFISKAFVGFIVTLSICAWIINFYTARWWTWPKGISSNNFGDSFGVVNSLFTGLAFIGVIWSVAMQRSELRENRKQTEIAKAEFSRSKDILIKQEDNIRSQHKAVSKQIFEETFFKLLSSLNEISEKINKERGFFSLVNELIDKMKGEHRKAIDEKSRMIISRQEAIIEINDISDDISSEEYEQSKKKLHEINLQVNAEKLRDPDISSFNNAYEVFFEENGDYLGKYFRYLYMLIKFIDNSTFADEEKRFYSKLVRGQFTTGEATLVAINYLSPYTTPSFNELYTKYGIAKNCDSQNYILSIFSKLLPRAIYGKSRSE